MEQVIETPVSAGPDFSIMIGEPDVKAPVKNLTEDSLFWLNLNASKSDAASCSSTPEPVSSSTSSLNSFDSESEDHKHALSTFYNKNVSNTSLATLVHKLTESTTTLNLDNTLEIASETDLPSVPSTPPPRSSGPRKTKSALKLPSLARSRSMPNATVKTVRFSHDLTRVKTFNEHAMPSSISLDNSPESTPTGFDDSASLFASGHPNAFFDLQNFNSSSSSEEEDDQDYFNHRSRSQFSRWTFKALNFDLFLIKNLVDKPVKLSSLQIVNNRSIHGTVEVSNFAFEKYVEIKFTTDSWKSIFLVTAKFERSLNAFKDQFTFDINLNRSLLMNAYYSGTSNLQQIDVGLCIKYVSDGCNEFYDNNNSQNYQLQLINKPRQKKLKSTFLSTTKPRTHLTNNFSSSSSSSTSSSSTSSIPSTASSNSSTGNYTSTSTRFFSDDTDYFNTHSVNHPKFNDWLKHSSVNYNSTSTNFTTPSTSLPSSSSSSLSSSSSGSNSTLTLDSVKKPILDGDVGGVIESDSQDKRYSEFLRKYCFFEPGALKENGASAQMPQPFTIK